MESAAIGRAEAKDWFHITEFRIRVDEDKFRERARAIPGYSKLEAEETEESKELSADILKSATEIMKQVTDFPIDAFETPEQVSWSSVSFRLNLD